ncbi:MAG: hypothetical protein AAF517_11420 [Planctomycetota bacterium]
MLRSCIALALVACLSSCKSDLEEPAHPQKTSNPSHSTARRVVRKVAPGVLSPKKEAPADSTGADGTDASTKKPGVSTKTPSKTEAPPAKESEADLAIDPKRISAKIKVKAGEDTAFSIKPKDDGGKIVDANDKEIGRLKLRGSKTLELKDDADVTIAVIEGTGRKISILDASGKGQFVLVRNAEGSLKVESNEKLLYRIKRRDYGSEVEAPDGKSLFKVKKRGDKLSVRNAADETIFSARGTDNTDALAFVALDKISDIRVRAAIVARLQMQR